MAFSTQLEYEVLDPGCDFIFNLQAAYTPRQTVVAESLSFNQALEPNYYTDNHTQSRFITLHALQGVFSIGYSAVVDLTHFEAAPSALFEVSPQALPGRVVPYLYPSRYCQSDRLLAFAGQQFGSIPLGYCRAQAICDWVTAMCVFRATPATATHQHSTHWLSAWACAATLRI